MARDLENDVVRRLLAGDRQAVADRQPVTHVRVASDAGQTEGVAAKLADGPPTAADAPLPPRRPPSEAFTAADAAPLRLATINGSQPILQPQFMRAAAR